MNKLICVDDGHGMTTPGKRTPFFPGTKKFMHENEFNCAVADLLKANLERCTFRTIMVAPGDTDVPLKTRTDTANNAKADLYISIHANALNGIWGNQQGISTHHYPGSAISKRVATIIHKYMIQGTQQKDRGIVESDFHVLRETKMPAVLVECAFMDNLREANLLLSDAFREECADEICKGICEYFAVPYVPAVTPIKDMIAYLNSIKIINDTTKWTAKATADNDIYWLIKKTYDYVKKG
ncbi:MAG: N-acetylmuramoyl-L-alanine amidase [Clostridiaceae bacterium]